MYVIFREIKLNVTYYIVVRKYASQKSKNKAKTNTIFLQDLNFFFSEKNFPKIKWPETILLNSKVTGRPTKKPLSMKSFGQY